MEKLEMSILEVLTDDARTPISQIAIMLGKSETEIAGTIARLERQRIILKYPALINWQKVDIDKVEAMIEVRVTPQRDEGFDAIAEQIYRFEEVSSVYLMSGCLHTRRVASSMPPAGVSGPSGMIWSMGTTCGAFAAKSAKPFGSLRA